MCSLLQYSKWMESTLLCCTVISFLPTCPAAARYTLYTEAYGSFLLTSWWVLPHLGATGQSTLLSTSSAPDYSLVLEPALSPEPMTQAKTTETN